MPNNQSPFNKVFIALFAFLFLLGTLYLAGADAEAIRKFGSLGALVIVGFSLIFWALSALLSKGRSYMIFRGLSKHSQSGENYHSAEAAQAAQDLQKKFKEGITTLRKNKVNLYEIPWYLIIGESGVGKTEAVRRSRIELIHGLHDPQQGKGGTRDMHWWFTANAVLLDTAGRMVFPEGKTQSTPAWLRFLELLKRYRTHCPVNGILLMISAESLLQDDEQEIYNKANKITKEVYSIRDALDLRFPIYVVVTKCDRVPGFNEFFQGIENCDQMLGWSNPNENFQTESLTSNLTATLNALKERRSALLRDRTFDTLNEDEHLSEKPESWYAFPNELEKSFPNLLKYLRTIFPEEGAFAGKRPFMRGIYFTSAMKEGAPLDIEVAKKFAVDVNELPEVAAAKDENLSYFLRDLFKRKIFPEKGMVTPESDTRKLVWKRNAFTLGFAYFGFFSLAIASFWGIRSLKKNITEQQAYWIEAAAPEHWSENGYWEPTIITANDGAYTSAISTPIRIEDTEESLLAFHARLNELAQSSIQLPPILKPISNFTQLEIDNDSERKRVQQLVFEKGILFPLYVSTRQKLLNHGNNWTPAHDEAILTLLRLEGSIEEKQLGGNPILSPFKRDLKTLFTFLTNTPAQEVLPQLFENTYQLDDPLVESWPPLALAQGATYKENATISSTIDSLIATARQKTANQRNILSQIKSISQEIATFEEIERRLIGTIGRPDSYLSFRDYMERVHATFSTYESVKSILDDQLKTSDLLDLSPDDALSLKAIYDAQVAAFEKNSIGQINELLKKINQQLGSYGTLQGGISGTLALETKKMLNVEITQLQAAIDNSLSPKEIAQLEAYDAKFLATYVNGDEPVYQHRNNLLNLCYYKIVNSEKPWKDLIGNLPRKVGSMKTSYLDSTNRITESQDTSIPSFQTNLVSIIDHLEHVRMENLSETYLKEAKAAVREMLAFPVILTSPQHALKRKDVNRFRGLLQYIQSDLTESVIELFSREDEKKCQEFLTTTSTIFNMIDVFYDERGEVRTCEFIVPDFYDQQKLLNEHYYQESSGLPFPGDILKVVQLNEDKPVRSNKQETMGQTQLNSDQIQFNFYRFPKDIQNSKVALTKVVSKNWAPIQHIYEGDAIPSSDLRTWDIPIWINPTKQADQPFFIRIQFDKPLPASKDDWPTMVSLDMLE